jgi:polysaccharide deacetylase 2 family uncharacterized protein YibQ
MDADLRQPLRRHNWRDRLKLLSPTPLRVAAFLVLASALGLALWLSETHDPDLGEPVVRLPVEPVASAPVVSEQAAPADDPQDGAIDLFAENSAPGLEATETQSAVILAPPIKLAPAPAKGLTENGPDGFLPKLATDGRRPFDVYARPVHKEVLQSSQPKLAILLGGMGINPDLTDKAANELPQEVTFAFAPYAGSLQRTIDATRARGHEVMLQLPMEPFGYPNHDPGPHTLLVSASPQSAASDLAWLLSRFTGYTGVVNYLGARFTGERTALEPVMRTLNSRGLVYFDDGSSQRSLAGEIAAEIGLPSIEADLTIDSDADFRSISAKLQRLEQLSRGGKIAIGVGTGLPATIEAVAAWAKRLSSRGIILVPVSAAYRPRSG